MAGRHAWFSEAFSGGIWPAAFKMGSAADAAGNFARLLTAKDRTQAKPVARR